MKRLQSALCIFAFTASLTASVQAGEWVSLFDGKTLDGWKGSEGLWSVTDGAITGTTTAENPIKHNTFLVWQGGDVSDFELKFKYRIVRGNSGVQYRSKLLDADKFIVGGYQADFEAGKTYSGILYEEKGRGILAQRGTKMEITAEGEKKKVGEHGKSEDIQAKIKSEDWNEYHITADGNHLIHEINGMITAEVTDNQEAKRAMSGILAIQVHAGPAMVVQVKDIEMKSLK